MKSKIKVFISILAIVLFINLTSAYLNVSLADHGSNIRNKTSGVLLDSVDLRVEIYDASSGGNLVYNETFSNAIINGSWNLMLGENSSNPLSLEFGKVYYKDYLINGENVNFTNLTGENVDRQFFYSPLGDIAGEDINASTNITASWFLGNISWESIVNNYWNTNYSDFLVTTDYALNDSLWTLNYSAFLTKPTWAQVTNGTLATWANVINGTIASWANVINGTLALSSDLSDYVLGTNVTYAYALNDSRWTLNYSTYLTKPTWGEVANGTMLSYADALNNTLMQQADWNATNTSYLLTTNSTYGYSLNDSLWTLNYSTYLTKPTWAQVINGTAISMTTGAYALNDSLWTLNYSAFLGKVSWANVINGTMLSYADALNETLALNASLATYSAPVGEPLWTLNYSTYLTKPAWAQVVNGTAISMTTGAYALNDSLWTLNYSAFLTKPTWAQSTNGTILARLTAANTFGAFNQTFDTDTFFINVNDDRVGVGTTTPQNKVNVIGQLNLTNTTGTGGLIWHNGTGLCIGSC